MYAMHVKSLVVLCLFIAQVLTEQCVTPNGKTGKCVSLKSCSTLQSAFQNPKKGTENHLRKLICSEESKDKKKIGEQDDFTVCCGLTSNLTIAEIEAEPTRDVNLFNFKNSEECGKIHSVFCSTADEDLNVPVVPWLVKVLVADSDGNAFAKCSGSLINDRYIVTGAQCVAGNLQAEGKRLVVRFGSTYIESKNVAEECSDVQYFEVEEVIQHPFYHVSSKLNDIALVRLNKTVLDKALYRPICLPISSNTLAKPDSKLSIPHWDEPSTEEKLSKHCKYMYGNKNITGSMATHDTIPVQFGNAVSITTRDDAGTPLMLNHDDKWYLEGIVTENKNCDGDKPGVYTKVLDYLPWIQENMRTWPAEQCTTPEGGTGTCMELGDCASLLTTSTNPSKALENQLHKYICEEGQFYGTFRVCCDQSLSFSVSSSSSLHKPFENNPTFTDIKQCGFQNLGNKNIASDEFPWLVRITPPGANNTLCLGSLINQRYVLTEAWCSYDLSKSTSVRLGESNKEKPEIVGIEEVTIHPFFVYWSRLNNIALIRLNKTITYTDDIQPICLPLIKESFAKQGDTLYTSGWDYASPQSGITRKRVSTKLISHEKCNLPFVKPVEKYSMCTMALRNNTESSCFGDSGGPLMFSHNNQWHIEGVVSTLDCNHQGQQVHTKVSEYLKWIEENLKPW